jgi:hypothetical protein
MTRQPDPVGLAGALNGGGLTATAAFASVHQAIPRATWTALSWSLLGRPPGDGEPGFGFDPEHPTGITAPFTGFYEIRFALPMTGTYRGTVGLAPAVNGALIAAALQRVVAYGGYIPAAWSGLVGANAGDRLEAQLYQTLETPFFTPRRRRLVWQPLGNLELPSGTVHLFISYLGPR